MSNPRFRFLDTQPIGAYICETCGELYTIEIRRYYDLENMIDDQPAIVETSVRTSCRCTPEVDIYAQSTHDLPIINLSRGIPY